MNTTSPRWIALSAGLLGFTGVGLGASGAHGPLHDTLVGRATLEHWRTAVLYQFVHAVALLAISGWTAIGARAGWIARCWIAGTILFSGSLYWLSLGGPKILGPVTPAGGLALLLGWLLVIWAALLVPKS